MVSIRSVVVSLLFLLCSRSYSTGPQLQWIKLVAPTIPGVATTATSVSTDSEDNIFVGGGPKRALVKLTASGDVLWTFGMTNVCCDPYITIRNIFVDNADSVTAFGDLYGTLRLGAFTNNSSSSSEFYSKFTKNGTNTAAKIFSNFYNFNLPAARIAGGGYAVGGGFDNVAAYEGITLNPTTYADGAVFNIAEDGSPIWVRKFIGGLNDSIDATASTADRSIIISGASISESVSGAGLTIGRRGERTIFLCNLDETGTGKWYKSVGTSLGAAVWSSAVTYSAVDNQIYWVGDFVGALSLGAEPISSSDRDVFLAKISTSGTVTWTRSIGGVGDQVARSVVTDGAGNVYVGGYFSSQLRVQDTTLFSNGSEDLFIAKYKSDGTLLWIKQIGSAGRDVDIALGFSKHGELLVVGSIGGGLQLDGAYIEGGGLGDAFIAKFGAEGEAPRFTIMPKSQVGSAGMTVTLKVEVAPNSVQPIFQWWFNGSKLTNQTNATLTVSNFQSGNAGNYYVVASNPSGQIQSDVAAVSFTDAANLVLNVHPSLKIFGTIGKSYRIDFADSTGLTPAWQSAGDILISTNPQIWIDTNAAVYPQRVYRVVLQ